MTNPNEIEVSKAMLDAGAVWREIYVFALTDEEIRERLESLQQEMQRRVAGRTTATAALSS